jgi:predicted membrane channel-forming protein YqfA (hemolysin III family)
MLEQFILPRIWFLGSLYGLITLGAVIQMLKHGKQFTTMTRSKQRLFVWTGGFAVIAGLWVVLWLTLLTTTSHPESKLLSRFLMFGFVAAFAAFGCGLNLDESNLETRNKRNRLLYYLIAGAILFSFGLLIYLSIMAILFEQGRFMNIFIAALLSALLITPFAAFMRWQKLRLEQIAILGLYGMVIAIAGSAIPDSTTTLAAVFAALVVMICWVASEAGAWIIKVKVTEKKEETTRW